jgi:hypothetical protein
LSNSGREEWTRRPFLQRAGGRLVGSNHAHAVEGDVTEELKAVCDMLDIDAITL